MKQKYIILLTALMLCSTINLFAQKRGQKIVDILMNEVVFRNLSENYRQIQGDGEAIPRFLEKVVENPQRISLADFRKEKMRYYTLVDEYNGLIDDIIGEIRGFEKLKEARKINLSAYHDRCKRITDKFADFINGLAKYNDEAFLGSLAPLLLDAGVQLVKNYFQEQVETLKAIMITELENLKLGKIGWEEAEAVIRDQNPVKSTEQIALIVNTKKAEHFKVLELTPGAEMPEIQKAYGNQKMKFEEEVRRTSNPDIQDFFKGQIQKLEAAKTYFDQNPPQKAVKPSVSAGNAPQGNTPCDDGVLRGKIEGLIISAEAADMDREQILRALQKFLEK